MKNEIYRFRSINSLIGEYKELENQVIFFATPQLLNDPMEGFRDMYWDGDFIAWRNLFKHYLLCLDRIFSMLFIVGEEHEILTDHIPLFSGGNDFTTSMYKKLFSKISENFFENEPLLTLIKSISKRTTPVRRDELYFYLRAVHPLAIETIFSEYETNKLVPLRESKYNNPEKSIINLIEKKLITLIEEGSNANTHDEKINVLFHACKSAQLQIELINRYHGSIDVKNKKKISYLLSFLIDIFPYWSNLFSLNGIQHVLCPSAKTLPYGDTMETITQEFV
ncbi:hypothetical protein [Pectobacterium versatile]|uniref:hypothetical protein n=1 Tax=Pectobacterium versatile TaxID=2488639 RepID=UPI0020C08969|nr:hypothetical protein [Pectobacterium versatile]